MVKYGQSTYAIRIHQNPSDTSHANQDAVWLQCTAAGTEQSSDRPRTSSGEGRETAARSGDLKLVGWANGGDHPWLLGKTLELFFKKKNNEWDISDI